MEGNYTIKWKSVDAAGRVVGLYEQDIYGKTLADAVAQFESFHGSLGPDEDGVRLCMTAVTWNP